MLVLVVPGLGQACARAGQCRARDLGQASPVLLEYSLSPCSAPPPWACAPLPSRLGHMRVPPPFVPPGRAPDRRCEATGALDKVDSFIQAIDAGARAWGTGHRPWGMYREHDMPGWNECPPHAALAPSACAGARGTCTCMGGCTGGCTDRCWQGHERHRPLPTLPLTAVSVRVVQAEGGVRAGQVHPCPIAHTRAHTQRCSD